MNKRWTWIGWLGLWLWSVQVLAQDSVQLELGANRDSLPPKAQLNIYNFKNINKLADYYDKQKLKRILGLQKELAWEEVYKELNKYVSEFGVQNFYKDTRMIWRLAKLTEIYGSREMARSLYRLVLRHHHQGIDIHEVEVYYDSLNRLEAAQYVPIDYYYELAEYRSLIDTLRPPRGILLNMGQAVNSPEADYGPTLNIANNVLLFTSKRNEERYSVDPVPNEDIFMSYQDAYGWRKAVEMEAVNTQFNEGSACLSGDGTQLFFSRCGCPGCYGDCDLFMATLQEDSTWGNVVNLGDNVNSVGWDSHPSLSHSGDTLYFASDRLGGFGLSDIYYTYKRPNGSWVPALNAGPVVNTRFNDVSPFYHPVYDVLYFSSNGQLYNFGEFDIYKSHRINEEWSEPLNIGPLVNGEGSEYYFTIDSDSELLFYARSTTRDLNRLDLYSFPLPMEAQPLATITVTGSLTDSLTGRPFNGIVSIIDLDDGVEVAPKFLNPDGTFEFQLIDQRNYLLIIQGDEFFRIEEVFYLDGPLEINNVTEPLASKVKFESIEFDVGRSELKEEMYADLNKIVNFLFDNPDFKLRISGHTDSFGSADVNLRLSRDRAKSIYDYMVEFSGLEPNRVAWVGYGNTRPIVPEERTEEDKRLNRRVEFEIYREGQVQESPE